MAGISYTFNGQLFEIKGIGLTAEQLKAIGDQQAATGSLIGLRPGDVLSAATQAQAGLQSAQSQVGQALSGVTGALGAGIPGATGILGSVSKSLASVGGALSGSLSAGVAGLTGAIGPAVSKIQGAFTGASGSITSLATTAIGTLNKAISGGIPTGSPINTADFVKQIPALGSVGSLTPPDVTGLLAQTKNLVGQAASKLSNFKGVGSFGLDVPQLETAGILKPGTSALQAATGASLRDMLKSASAFTGKLGIKSAEALLANAPAQAQIQQQLMVKGLAGAAALGIPTGILSGPALGAVSVLAAKSVSNAVAWLKGAPAAAGVPSSAATAAAAIAPGVTNADVARMSAYSVNLTKEKVPEVFKAQVTPTPAVDTCNRATVTACTDGQLDPKIPAPQFTKTDKDPVTGSKRDAITAGFDAALTALETSNKQFENVLANLQVLENQQVITQQQFDSIATEWKAAAAYGDNARKTIIDPAFALYESAVSSYSPGISERAVGLLGIRNNTSPVRIQFYQLTSAINSEQRVQLIRATGLQTRIKELKKRISTNVS
jgi:hypothetical protein